MHLSRHSKPALVEVQIRTSLPVQGHNVRTSSSSKAIAAVWCGLSNCQYIGKSGRNVAALKWYSALTVYQPCMCISPKEWAVFACVLLTPAAVFPALSLMYKSTDLSIKRVCRFHPQFLFIYFVIYLFSTRSKPKPEQTNHCVAEFHFVVENLIEWSLQKTVA